MHNSFSGVSRDGPVIGSLIMVGVFFSVTMVVADVMLKSFSTGISSDLNVTQLPINRPGNVNPGDVLVANIAVNGGSVAQLTAPSPNWNVILRTDNDSNVSVISYWKIADASEPASYTWLISPQNTAVGGITSYSGVDITNPIDDAGGAVGRSQTAEAPSITTTSEDAKIVTFFAFDAGKTAVDHFATSSGIGMTETYDITNTPYGPSAAMSEGVQAVAGPSGAKSSAINYAGQRDWAAQQIALRPAPDSTLLNGLVSYWKLDENSGDAFSSLNAYILSNIGSADYVSSKINNGWSGDANNTTKALVTNSILGFNYSTPFTYNFWINVTSQPAPNTAATLLQWSDNETPNNHGYHDVQLYNDNGTMQIYIGRNNVALNEQFGANYTFIPGAWYMLTYSWDGSVLKLFINDNISPIISAPSISTGTNGVIGIGTGFKLGADTFTNRYFSGLLDEVGVWNRVLTPIEVTRLYNAGQGIQHPF